MVMPIVAKYSLLSGVYKWAKMLVDEEKKVSAIKGMALNNAQDTLAVSGLRTDDAL